MYFYFFPSECDVSIRPGWFYHPNEDSRIKSVDHLTDIYFKSVGRNSNLLLNVPPNKEGLISERDIQRLREWNNRLEEIFSDDIFKQADIETSNYRENYSVDNCLDDNRNTFWTTDKELKNAEIEITFSEAKKINIIRLEEAIEYGQRIRSFEIFYDNSGSMEKIFEGTTIGRSRIVTFDEIKTKEIRILINDSFAAPTLRIIKGFYHSSVKRY